MYRERLRRVLGHLKRALRMEQRLTVEEFNQRLQLSEAIIDYGRMIQAFYGYSVPDAIVEVTELANRFRERPQTIKDTLRLLRDMGRAEPADLDGNCNWHGLFPAVARAFTWRRRHSHT